MRTEFNMLQLRTVAHATGLMGQALNLLTGAALITATLGKVPVKKDLAFYVGETERDLDRLSKTALDTAWLNKEFRIWNGGGLGMTSDGIRPQNLYYALATELISRGAFRRTDHDDVEYNLARDFLNNYIHSSDINTRALFAGYTICLEYLTTQARGMEINLHHFIRLRYGKIAVHDFLHAFCEYVSTTKRDKEEKIFDEQSSGYLSILMKLLRQFDRFIYKDVLQ